MDPKKFVYRNAVTYEVPGSLADLTGPSTGVINLPRIIYWGPEETVDLADPVDIRRMYQALVRMGTVAQQVEWLNRDSLIEAWPDLVLPARCISHWEDSFPELQRARHTVNNQQTEIREVVGARHDADSDILDGQHPTCPHGYHHPGWPHAHSDGCDTACCSY
ncbi:hypothetical protein ACX3O0_07070 [Homoserinimonas sp. A447]